MNLESIYDSMNRKHAGTAIVNRNIIEERCYATYAVGKWSLQNSFRLLQKRLHHILDDTAYYYSPTQGCVLHQTLLQYHSFATASSVSEEDAKKVALVIKDVLDGSKALWIHYKGIVWTPTGLALCGYPQDPDDYNYIMGLREQIETVLRQKGFPYDIPYHNDIVHATLIRWKKQPSEEQLLVLKEEVVRWSEAYLGEIHINEWQIGLSSWRQLATERKTYETVAVYRHICHRGNLLKHYSDENDPDVLDLRVENGYDVECDVWYYKEELWLGHDEPEHVVTIEWLDSPRKLVHAKDGKTFEYLLEQNGLRGLDLHIFYHTTEDYILTNKGVIIAYPGKPLLEGSLCMMPERATYSLEERKKLFFLCSDSKDGYTTYFSDQSS